MPVLDGKDFGGIFRASIDSVPEPGCAAEAPVWSAAPVGAGLAGLRFDGEGVEIAEAGMHRLVSTRVAVPPDRAAAYGEAWERVRRAAEPNGAHAWLFASAGGTFRLELLEWGEGVPDPTRRPELSAALSVLRAAFPGEEERWEEEP